MPICFICKEELLNITFLHIRFEFKHKQIEFYVCVETDCQNRKFDSFGSLRKHFNLYHNVQKPQKSVHHNKRLENNEQDYTHNVYHDNSFKTFNFNSLIHNNFDMQNCTTDKIVSFFARLLSNYLSLSKALFRKHVQNLYQEIQEFFFNDCLGEIECCLNTISTSNNNKIVINKIQTICENYKNSFYLMSTE